MSRIDNDLVCPCCFEIRGSVLSLGCHISAHHRGREGWFAQMVCNNDILSCKESYKAMNKDKRVAAAIAERFGRAVRYYKTGKTNYKMPQEFRFQRVQIRHS